MTVTVTLLPKLQHHSWWLSLESKEGRGYERNEEIRPIFFTDLRLEFDTDATDFN